MSTAYVLNAQFYSNCKLIHSFNMNLIFEIVFKLLSKDNLEQKEGL